ncbi:MAG: urea transporter [Bacteroidales bacterium]|jgi:urea transporter|nr:urea transporter [Bacteroidales bacterium]MCK9498766.1 urea transporter [Bacteroidales bacterium]MDY0314304.1 urea transporter [Bacteroidales bacterium]NLB85911.1 urea transporter [Bacteroidales bacterium]
MNKAKYFYNKLQNSNSIFTIVLKGISQIFLQENILTGLLFIIGVFVASYQMGIALVFATLSGSLTALVFKFSKENLYKGLYGFSASLLGVGLLFFFESDLIIWIFIFIGSVIASLLQEIFIRKNIPAFTLPFVIVTWISIFILKKYFHYETISSTLTEFSNWDYLKYPFRGFGQVIFQANLISGILFFVGVIIASKQAGKFGFFASISSGLLAMFFLLSNEMVFLGLFSYNAVLSAIAFADNSKNSWIWASISVLLSFIISFTMFKFELIQLTFPFVLASMIVVYIKRLFPS